MSGISPTDVQDAVIDRMEGPASAIEQAIGLSIHVVTSALYVVALLFPVASALRFGLTPVGAVMLPAYVIVFSTRLQSSLRMAARGPVGPSAGRAMNPDRASPAAIILRLTWDVLTLTAFARVGIVVAAGRPVGPQLWGLAFVVAGFVALHLHACSPKPGLPRRVAAASPA